MIAANLGFSFDLTKNIHRFYAFEGKYCFFYDFFTT